MTCSIRPNAWLAAAQRPSIVPIAALKARVWIRQGKVATALEWGRERGLSIDDELSYGREFEHITLARAHLADPGTARSDHAVRAVIDFLDRLLAAAEAGGRHGNAIEILTLQALAHEIAGRSFPGARVAGASPGAGRTGGRRPPLRGRAPVAGAPAGGGGRSRIVPEVSGKLLAAFETAKQPGASASRFTTASLAQPLVEPLSERELEILRLIAQGLSNQEIGERLYLALDTVKGHNRHIFGKLQVQRRTEAIARARELGLI